jgi:hypothetical protein
VGVSLNPTLRWTGGDPKGESVTYTVVVNGEVKCQATAQESCDVKELGSGLGHLWRVIAKDAAGQITTGPLWDFTTNIAPGAATNPSPSDGSSGHSTALTLAWTAGSDPDGQPSRLQHRVLLDSSNPPETVYCDWADRSTCTVSSLKTGGKYYWRVETTDGDQAVEGPVWNLQTTSIGIAPP